MDEQSDLTSASGPGPGKPGQTPPGEFGRLFQQPRIRLGAVVALAIAVGFIVWAVVGGGDNKSSSTSSSSPQQTPATGIQTGPIGLSAQGLQAMQATLHQPIYWAGPKPGYTYEFRREASGRIYVRYLAPRVKVGAPGANFLIVATYPFPDAFKILRDLAKGTESKVPGGGIAVVQPGYPKSVHMAFPGVDYQIEVYDPSPARALAVASSGHVASVR